MSTKAFALLFCDWLVAALDLDPQKIILADSGRPEPEQPYATVKDYDRSRTGSWDETRQIGGAFTHCGERDHTISVQLYGPGAYDLLNIAMDQVENDALVALADKLGITITDVGKVNNLSQVLDTEFEERAQCDLVVAEAVNNQQTGTATVGTVDIEIDDLPGGDSLVVTGG